MFPFDDGREYDVVLDPARLPGVDGAPWRQQLVTAVVGKPAVARTPSTVVTHVYPSADIVPANQLRMYLHFSAPMDWRSGYDYLTLLDERGQEVVDAFLPLDADFWNDDRTRYTVFFDPGRVKRGILPNRQMGRALEAGKRYTLVVKREWRDGHGLPLKEEFRHEFRASPPIERALTMTAWRVTPPKAGTREPVAVTFPNPLDHGLLRRALGVAKGGAAVVGDVSIESDETRWLFTPRDAWAPGDYELVALAFLEDLAGNRIGRAVRSRQLRTHRHHPRARTADAGLQDRQLTSFSGRPLMASLPCRGAPGAPTPLSKCAARNSSVRQVSSSRSSCRRQVAPEPDNRGPSRSHRRASRW